MSVRLAIRRDADAVAAMLARAFADDPAFSWMFPDAAVRARKLPRLFRLMLASDAAAGMALVTADGEAAALWRAPGRAQVGMGELLRQAGPLALALGGSIRRALAVAAQGRGFGGEAIRAGLTRAAGRLSAYLETATGRNLGFYRGLGFAVTGEWDVPRGGPHFWSMLRAPD